MRFLIRSADFKDKNDLLDLARCFPLCSLSDSPSKMAEKIQISKESFNHTLPKEERNHLFVMEDRQEKKIIGSSQILSYFKTHQSLCYFLEEKRGKPPLLKLKRVKTGLNQIGGLILHPNYRKSRSSLGLQIGAVRFLYIKTFPKEFSPVIEVSLTAPVKGRKNHFWEETGRKHLKINYSLALKKFQENRPNFLSSFPKNAIIPIHQLSPEAKACMEQVHPQTLPVYKGLLKRGFYKTDRYHVIDGGIYLESHWKNLPFLKQAKLYRLKKEKEIKNSSFLLSQQTEEGFFCAQVKGGIKQQDLLASRFPKEFKEGKKVLALNFPF